MVITFEKVIRSKDVDIGLNETHKNGVEEMRGGTEAGDEACR